MRGDELFIGRTPPELAEAISSASLILLPKNIKAKLRILTEALSLFEG